MTDNEKSKSKPHEFREAVIIAFPDDPGRRAWVPEAEAQEKIAELENTVRLRGERLDAYVEEIERLREACAAEQANATYLAAQAKASEAAAAEAIRSRDACARAAALDSSARPDLERQIQDLRAALESTRIEGARQATRAKVWRRAALVG